MLTIIVSTANQRISGLNLKPVHSDVCYVVVHQVYDESYTNEALSDFISRDDVTYIRLDYPGLSKSRNVGLSSVKTKYAYIMDDDVDFDLAKMSQLVNWMEVNQVDVATCQFVFENDSLPRSYSDASFKHTMLSAAKVSSIEICANVEKLRENGINFDERFGLGTNLPSGEEYVFMTDCIKAGLHVWFYPVTTGVHPNITSGMDFYTSSHKTLAKREMFKRIFGWKAFLFILAFWLKKSPSVIKAGHFGPFTKTMLLGLK
ncbi:glycosyltransferase [Thiomicrospira sp. ALE5]|uniref:glycosyltransferase n=1 Tax=Thiomicrospira sp. ALE5 TaxID=748650 RepID=UPI0008E9F37C|nr:glycosyltransferase [Thiomicrospira sp. ALE5]SFR49316.1 Glycosyl transferase family 2 [Thiomicrospira sp. ALE5]